jgi:hypothetical protein
MPTAVLQTNNSNKTGNVKVTTVTKSITHSNARLYHEGGRSYEYVGDDASGNRIYRDTKKR